MSRIYGAARNTKLTMDSSPPTIRVVPSRPQVHVAAVVAVVVVLVVVVVVVVVEVVVVVSSGPLPALVGNNRVHIGGWMLVSYYLPGNRIAPPPGPRANGIPAQAVAEQAI